MGEVDDRAYLWEENEMKKLYHRLLCSIMVHEYEERLMVGGQKIFRNSKFKCKWCGMGI